MNPSKDAELYDWDMSADDDFEDTFEDTHGYPDERQGSYVATSPDEWIRFSTDGLNHTESRKEGDGTSIDSQTYVVEGSDTEEEDEEGGKQQQNENQQSNRDQTGEPPNVYNKHKAYLPTNGQSDTARFKILDDEYDISPDVEPMEFRGSLKTDADAYGKTAGSGRCICIRYLSLALLMFAFGILVGYFAGVRSAPVESLEVPGSPVAPTETTWPTTRMGEHNATSAYDSTNATGQGAVPASSQDGPQLI